MRDMFLADIQILSGSKQSLQTIVQTPALTIYTYHSTIQLIYAKHFPEILLFICGNPGKAFQSNLLFNQPVKLMLNELN